MISNRVPPRSPGLIRAQEIQLKILAAISAEIEVEENILWRHEIAYQAWEMQGHHGPPPERPFDLAAPDDGRWHRKALQFQDHFGVWPGDL